MSNFIDAHSHVWTPDTQRYPLAPGFNREAMRPASWTPEELMAHAKPEGVDRVVLIQMSFYQWDNSYMLNCMDRFPDLFAGVALVDWTADRPEHEMSRLANRGVTGFRVRRGDAPAETWAETPSFHRMFAFARDHRLAICPLIDPDCLSSLGRMCNRYPETPVVIDHMCRIGADGVIRDRDIEALGALAVYPAAHVKTSAFYALGAKAPPHADLEPLIRRLHGFYGANRLMWASDCPFAVVNEKYRDSIALVRDGCPWLTPAEREQLLRATAQRIFFP